MALWPEASKTTPKTVPPWHRAHSACTAHIMCWCCETLPQFSLVKKCGAVSDLPKWECPAALICIRER